MQAVAVKAINGWGVTEGRGNKSGWRAYATVTIGDPTPDLNWPIVANVTFTGTFSTGGTASCVTDSQGVCTVSSSQLSLNDTSTTIIVDSLTGTNVTYDANTNSTPSISIPRP